MFILTNHKAGISCFKPSWTSIGKIISCLILRIQSVTSRLLANRVASEVVFVFQITDKRTSEQHKSSTAVSRDEWSVMISSLAPFADVFVYCHIKIFMFYCFINGHICKHIKSNCSHLQPK